MVDSGSSVRMGVEQEYARKAAVEHAKRWTTGQAARLATLPDVILEAVGRGWLAEDIERADSKYAFESCPPVHV